MAKFTGKTVEDALQQASRSLKKPVKELRVQVIKKPRHGFLGIGRRNAVIEATAVPQPNSPKTAAPVKPQMTAGKKAAVKPDQLQGKQTPVISAQPEMSTSSKAKSHHGGEKKKGVKQAGDEVDPAVIQAHHEANLKRVRSAGKQLTHYLQDIFRHLGVQVEPEITNVQAHEIQVDIKTTASGRVIGHHGQRINALEKVSEAFMNYHGAPKASVILDTSNYRARRQKALHELAQRSLTEVVASGQAVFLDPMPARERKQLHKELEGNPHVRTYSHGREPYRSVVVAPQN